MTCEEAQQSFSLHQDDQLAEAVVTAVDAHLQQCPVCRAELIETRRMLRLLARLERPAAPSCLAASINNRLVIERAAHASQPPLPLLVRFRQWLEPRAMPYTVGALASLILFAAMYGALRPHLILARELELAMREPVTVVASANQIADEFEYDVTRPVSLAGYAASRTPYTVESPSLNPQGALAALAWSASRGQAGDDDMIVVADVFSNGSASLAAVVEPPRNRQMLDDFQSALRRNPAFVPASLDGRPQTMRVVFVLQKMDVRESSF